MATHIVGGGFSYRRLAGSNYRFSLTLYFDLINGNPAAKDQNAICHIFEKGTNVYINSYDFPLVSFGSQVPFSNPACASAGFVRTEILVYETTINLASTVFNHPQGYYIVWERCCRNGVITNISTPGDMGQTFYMEFPPVTRNNQAFLNNSPIFRPITSDYPCINNPFQLSFQADDVDGDSLVYSLINPLRGNSTRANPNPNLPVPGPYDPVLWRPGFSAQIAIPGNPSLQVNSQTGILNLTASMQGLFVFSVLCQEYRNGVKIGEIRREMQIFVKDCPNNPPPQIIAIQPLTGLRLQNLDTLYFESGLRGDCRQVKITYELPNQLVRFRYRPISQNTPSFLSKDTTFSIVNPTDSVPIRICIPACGNASTDNPWKILLTASDQVCGKLTTDSLTLNLVVKPEKSKAPILKSTTFIQDTIRIVQTEKFIIPLEGIQEQGANLQISGTLTGADGIEIPWQQNGIRLPFSAGTGQTNASFEWPEICFLPDHQPLKLTCILRSQFCQEVLFDTLIRYIYIQAKKLDVRIESSLNPEYASKNPILLMLDENQKALDFTLTGRASENRMVNLKSEGDLKSIPGYFFEEKSGEGKIDSPFRFATNCSTPAGPFRLTFQSISKFCNVDYSDSISYIVNYKPDSDSVGLLPNLLTLNNDDKNDVFSLATAFPKNNCKQTFKFIKVVNRWGKEVFYSEDIGFQWKPQNVEPGIYFVYLEFSSRKHKDWLFLVR
jgi:hypothetical protein